MPRRLTLPLRRDGLDPVPALRARRNTGPVSRLGSALGMTIWLVTGYDEVRAVLRDSGSFSTDIRPLLRVGDAPDIGGLGFTDPPDHTRLRRLLAPHFTARRLTALEPVIERIISDQLDGLGGSGEIVDLAADFAFPVPFRVICELLGLSVDQREHFQQLGRSRFDARTGAPSVFGAMSESHDFMLAEVRRQRVAPGPGLIGELIREHGDAVSDAELARLVDGVFTGGYETSASMLTLGTVVLLLNPQAAATVRAGEQVAGVVEELLRYLSVVQIAFPRFARQDMTLSGQRIRAGDVVACSLSGANRDPLVGADPETFDPARSAPAHVSFGYGIHRCVGAELARVELRLAFHALLRRYPELSLAVDAAQLRYRKLSIVYGVDRLPVRLGRDSGR